VSIKIWEGRGRTKEKIEWIEKQIKHHRTEKIIWEYIH
jgi:hypothetical protein